MAAAVKPRYLGIELDHHDGVYYGGQKLKGVVTLEADEPITIMGLELTLYGGARVAWEVAATTRGGRAEPYSTEETYVSDTFMLWGAARGDESLAGGSGGAERREENLSKGRHLFPFNWSIPGDAPSSFEGDSGSVRYYAEASLKLPGCGSCCHNTMLERANFTVLRHLDLNSDKAFASPVREEKELTLTSGGAAGAAWCRPGRLAVSLSLPRQGYVPGEHVHADVDVHNTASRKIRATSIALRRLVRYGGGSGGGGDAPPTRTVSSELVRVYGDVVRPRRRHCWSSRGLQVPPAPPSRLDGCAIIDVKYELQLQVELSPFILSLVVPITVGTIPLSDSYLTTWTYREVPFQRGSKQSKRQKLKSKGRGGQKREAEKSGGTPACQHHDPAAPHLVHNQALLAPKYRFYYTSTPVITKTKNVTPLECSPGLRRRSMFVCRTIRLKSRCDETLLESIV